MAFVRDASIRFQPSQQILITHELHDRIGNRFIGYLRQHYPRNAVHDDLTAVHGSNDWQAVSKSLELRETKAIGKRGKKKNI